MIGQGKITPSDRDRVQILIKSISDILERLEIVTPCKLCINYNRSGNTCSYWDAVVPDDAMHSGCDEWEEDRFSIAGDSDELEHSKKS